MKYVITLLILLAGTITKAESVRTFFISEPGKVFVLIPQGVRAAMITMAEEGKKIVSNNSDNGTVQIDSLTESFISVHCSDAKQVEIKMLTKGKSDTVLAVVETMRLPAMDSKISFYNTRWQPIAPGKCLKGGMVEMRHFIKRGTPAAMVEMIERTIPFPLIWLSFPLVFLFVSAPIVPRCRRVIPLLALAVALCRGFIYKKIVASSLFLIIYE